MLATKCQPPQSPYHKHDFNICTESTSFDPLFLENINDVADTMVEIMVVCGIQRCKAELSKSLVINAFQFYDIKRHRFNAIEERGICRSDLICDFKFKCMMTPVEALLAYNIIKRAIKAFYHGTPDYSIRSPITEAVILKEQEFIWKHAATRTIQLFEPYEHIFYQAHRNYDKKIFKIYKKLYERLRQRADPVIVEDYHPRGCVQKVIIGTISPPKLDNEKVLCVEKCRKTEDMKSFIKNMPNKEFSLITEQSLSANCEFSFKNENNSKSSPVNSLPEKKQQKTKNIDLNLPRCYQCNCPQLMCDCNIERDTGILAIDCSQGPYQCQWFRVDKDEKTDLCIEKRELHQCPVDCLTSESSSESDECKYCECSDEDEMDENEKVAEEEDYEDTDNEETLERIMAKDLPKRTNTDQCQIRKISKIPTMKSSIKKI